MSTIRIRRLIARACIWICVACVAIAALAFTIAPHRYPFAGVLRIDVPAIVSIIVARIYLYRTGGQP
jgi:hypothetical protein